MTGGQRYLIGFAATGLIGIGIALALGPAVRREAIWGVVLGLVVQAPLGWWILRSIGTERFQVAWIAGILIRLGVVAIAGLVLIPAFGWRLVPALGALVATVLVLLLVEVVTAMREHPGT
jgi:hypothetical protein